MILENGTNMPLAPQAFAETAPQFWPSYFVPRLGMSLETAFASYGQLYRTQPWVYAAVRKVARSTARLGAAVWDQSPAKGRATTAEHLSSRTGLLSSRSTPTPWRWPTLRPAS
jgi:hypothetical protein